MNVLAVLEVAIGIIFVWFLLSLLVSTIQEAIANIFQWRGKDLERAILRLLEDPMAQQATRRRAGDWLASLRRRLGRLGSRRQPALAPVGADASMLLPAENSFAVAEGGVQGSDAVALASRMHLVAESLGTQFYTHPLIKALSQDIRKRKPAYIPTAQFSEVVMDLIVKAGTAESPLRQAADRAERDTKELEKRAREEAREAFHELIEWIEETTRGRGIDEALTRSIDQQAEALTQEYPSLKPAVLQLKAQLSFPRLLAQLGAGIEALAAREHTLAPTLDILISRAVQNTRDADQALANARKNVENWFDSSMQRLSGAYKRKVQAWAFGIGLAVALILNVDTIAVLRALSSDPSVRAVIAVQAQDAVQASAASGEDQTAQQILARLGALQLPIGWTWLSENTKDPTDTRCDDYLGSFITSIHNPASCLYPASYNPKTAPYRAIFWQSIGGMLITAIAAMQGSPFWFGVLSKIVNLRTSTAPPGPEYSQK